MNHMSHQSQGYHIEARVRTMINGAPYEHRGMLLTTEWQLINITSISGRGAIPTPSWDEVTRYGYLPREAAYAMMVAFQVSDRGYTNPLVETRLVEYDCKVTFVATKTGDGEPFGLFAAVFPERVKVEPPKGADI